MKRTVEMCLTLFLLALTSPLQASEGKEIVEKMIQKLRGHVNVAEYEMTVVRPNWTRSIKIKTWDDRSNKRVFVRILAPPKDEGTSFLRIGYNLWNYLPKVEKVMKIPPSMMLQPWMGSDFTNDDLVKESSYIDDYDHQIVAHETVEGEVVVKVELIPHPQAPVVWGKVIFWVREKDFLPVRQHFLDEKGRLVKDLQFKDLKVMDGILFPSLWEMATVSKPDHKTTLKLLSIDFDPVPPIAESFFTERNLRL